MTKADRNRIKALLTEAITVLCKNGLTYKDEFAIEGLLGITLDSSEVFLVSINETIKNELAEARESLRQQEAAAAQKLSSAGQRHSASPVKQVPHSVPVSRHATHSSPGSHQKNIPQPVSVYKNSKSGQYQQIHPSATRKRSVDESSQDVEEDLELHVQAVEQGEDQELDDLNETFQTEQSDSVISRLSDSASGEPPSKRAARDESYRTDSRSPAESGDSENESKYKPEEPDIIFVKQEVTDDTDENSSASQSRTRIPQSGEDPQPGCSNWDASNNQLNINSPTSFLPTPDQQQVWYWGQHGNMQRSLPVHQDTGAKLAILHHEGPFVIPRVLSRKSSWKYSGRELVEAMEQLTMPRDHPLYVGEMHYFPHNAKVFYKCPPSMLKPKALQTFGINLKHYELCYNHKVDIAPKGAPANWESFVEKIVRESPFQEDSLSTTRQSQIGRHHIDTLPQLGRNESWSHQLDLSTSEERSLCEKSEICD